MTALDSARRDLQQASGSPVSDFEWGQLVALDRVKDYMAHGLVEDFVADLGEIRRANAAERPATTGVTNRPRRTHGSVEEARERAVMALHWAMASCDPLVKGFRGAHLHNRLLTADDVPGWIAQRQEESGRPVALDAAGELGLERRAWSVDVVPLYFVEDGEAVKTVVAERTADGDLTPLSNLAWLASEMADRYRWTEPEATMFVLTASIPHVPLGWARTDVREVGSATRITLTIDPAMSPRDVSAWYSEVRGRIKAPQRLRPVEEKAARLVDFVTQQRVGAGNLRYDHYKRRWEDDDGGWAETRRSWSETHPDWRYPNSSRFGRAFRDARAIIGAPGWKLPG